MKRKEVTCKFCGKTTIYDSITKRIYELDGVTFHVKNCPNRAKHFHEKALDDKETERQNRFGEYNRRGTESSEGIRLADGLELQEEK